MTYELAAPETSGIDPAVAVNLAQWDRVDRRLTDDKARQTALLAMIDVVKRNTQQQPSTGETI